MGQWHRAATEKQGTPRAPPRPVPIRGKSQGVLLFPEALLMTISRSRVLSRPRKWLWDHLEVSKSVASCNRDTGPKPLSLLSTSVGRPASGMLPLQPDPSANRVAEPRATQERVCTSLCLDCASLPDLSAGRHSRPITLPVWLQPSSLLPSLCQGCSLSRYPGPQVVMMPLYLSVMEPWGEEEGATQTGA